MTSTYMDDLGYFEAQLEAALLDDAEARTAAGATPEVRTASALERVAGALERIEAHLTRADDAPAYAPNGPASLRDYIHALPPTWPPFHGDLPAAPRATLGSVSDLLAQGHARVCRDDAARAWGTWGNSTTAVNKASPRG